jgi:hypothetical protein
MTNETSKNRTAAARAAKAEKLAAGRKNAEPPIADDWGVTQVGDAAADDWGVLDLAAQRDELPPPGWRPATISDVKTSGNGDVLWCSISYALTGTSAIVQEMEPLAAKPTATADRRQRVERGKIMLGRVQRATGADLAGVRLTNIGERLIGKSCFVLVAHGDRYGVPVLHLRSVADQPR